MKKLLVTLLILCAPMLATGQHRQDASSRPTGNAPAASLSYNQLVAAGYDLLKEARVGEAYLAAMEAAKKNPGRFEAYALAALALHVRGADREAKPLVDRALALVPRDKKAKVAELAKLIDGSASAEKKPTLAETLAWLSDKIQEFGAYPKVYIYKDSQRETNLRMETRFAAKGCEVAVEERKIQTLGSGRTLTSWQLWRVSLAKVLPNYSDFVVEPHSPVGQNSRLVNGPGTVYTIRLYSDGKAVSLRTFEDEVQPELRKPPSDDVVGGLEITVTDQAIAQRIATALKYAVELCHAENASKREPF